MTSLLDGIDQFGWAAMPSCLTDADCLRLRAECDVAGAGSAFRPAGIGRALDGAVREDIRGDRILWLDSQPAETSVEQHAYLAKLELLRLALNQRFFLGLFEFEGHFAVYPEGAFYKAHLDCHSGVSDRIITIILYLNPHWQPGDGGELKLRTTAGDKGGPFVLIEPRMGTLVCFLAADFWHEVLPAVKARMSITGWFRQR